MLRFFAEKNVVASGLVCILLVGAGGLQGVSAQEQALSRQQDEVASEVASIEMDEAGLISMEFLDVGLSEILKAFSVKSGLNVIAAGDVADMTMTLYLEDVTVLDALDQILSAGNLTYERQPGSDIIIVKPIPEDTVPDVITRVYRLRFARVSTTALARAAASFSASTPFEGGTSGRSSGSGSGGGSSTGGPGGGSAATVGIDIILESLLTEHGEMSVDERTNTLIVSDIPENFAKIEATLSVLDIMTPQILVESELIEVTLNKLKNVGVNWSNADGDLFKFTPATSQTRFPWNHNIWATAGKTGLADDDVAGVATLGSLDPSTATAMLRAIQADTDSKILARPKVIIMDNESAIIRMSTNQAVSVVETTDQDTNETTVEIEREETGVVLVVTPQVNDNGYITMLIEPSVTQVVAASVSSNIADIIDPKQRSVRSLLRIKDGDTLVMGGLIDRQEEVVERGIPFLKDVPLLGNAFKYSSSDVSETELIVFVTPTILKNDATSTFTTHETIKNRIVRELPLSVGMSPREQEAPGPRESEIEDTLSAWE